MAAAPSTLGEQIREELSCSICLELFTRPKMLPCQHTFCQDCLQDHASRRAPFQCPNCRLQVKLPSEGVAGLPDNRIVVNLCEMFQQQATLSEETREQPQPGNRCSFHPSEEVRLYCTQCQVPLCVDCVEEGHEGHPTMSIKKALQKREDLITEGRNIFENYLSFLRALRDEEKSLDDQKQDTDSKIEEAYRQACDQIIQTLTEEKDRLLSEVDTNHTKNKGAVQNYRTDVLRDMADLTAALRTGTDREGTHGGSGILLDRESNLTDLVPRLREKTVPSPLQTHPAVFQPTRNFACTLGKVTVPGATTFSGDHSQTTTYEQWTIKPSTTIKFGSPEGVTVSDEGDIFIADMTMCRIVVLSTRGPSVRQFKTAVNGGLMEPHDVALDGDGSLWVVGSSNFAVQYDKHGRELSKINLQAAGGHGVSNGVAVDTRRDLILVTRKAVFVFERNGKLVQIVGPRELQRPYHVAVDGEGRIVVADNDCKYSQVKIYRQDGELLLQFGARGNSEGQLYCPQGICTDTAGNIIVADTRNNRVELFDKTGKFLKHITAGVKDPCAVAMTKDGELVITSTYGSVTIFKPNSAE